MKKRFSKALTLLLAIAMLATQFSVFTFAAEVDGYCSVCEGNGKYDDGATPEYSIAPTCGEEGFDIYACVAKDKDGKDCTGTVTVKIPATGTHTSNNTTVKAVDPTCTEKGSKAYELCTDCGCYLEPGTTTKMDSIEIAANGHNYGSVVTGPTCDAEGYTTYTCSVCNDTYVDNKVPAHGHKYDKKVDGQKATCREEGWSEYYVCSVCDKEDPDRPKKILGKEDHNLKLLDSKAATCTDAGFNRFGCEEPTCPYYKGANGDEGITENIAALGHDKVNHEAKAPTCTEVGYDAYETCNRCDLNTKGNDIPALGHTHVATGYKAPTCTENGTSNAIVCDRCGFVHNPGDETPALGHDFTPVAAKAPNCTDKGNIAHNKCTVCNKNFAADAKASDITAQPIDVEVAATGHNYETITIDSTCTEKGYTVYTCTNVDNGTKCGHTYSEAIAAKGHNFEKKDEVAATCTNKGTKAYNKCTVCNKKFAIDANPADTTIREVSDADLEIAALGHVEEDVKFNAPTYDAAGNHAGKKCSRCGEYLSGNGVIAELDEAVKFYYEIAGVNGANTAVNSGYVILNVYFDVLADADDNKDWNSDVLANIFGVDFAMNFDKDVFHLTDVEAGLGTFQKAEFTPLDKANGNGNVTISQDMVEGYKVFRGQKNLFATLTFQVDTAAAAGNYAFNLTDLNVVHPENETIATDASAQSVAIDVEKLGDANGDGKFSANDTLAISQYIKNPDIAKAYITKYDMDKDGDIDFIDLDLVRKAIVGNDEYLGIQVDPNKQ